MAPEVNLYGTLITHADDDRAEDNNKNWTIGAAADSGGGKQSPPEKTEADRLSGRPVTPMMELIRVEFSLTISFAMVVCLFVLFGFYAISAKRGEQKLLSRPI